MNDADLPLWLTANDLARFFRLSKRTIRRYHRLGMLPPARYLTKRTLRWHRADIVDLLKSGPMPIGYFKQAIHCRLPRDADEADVPIIPKNFRRAEQSE